MISLLVIGTRLVALMIRIVHWHYLTEHLRSRSTPGFSLRAATAMPIWTGIWTSLAGGSRITYSDSLYFRKEILRIWSQRWGRTVKCPGGY